MANNPYVNKVIKSDGTTIMDISDSTVTADKLAQGYTAYNAAGELIMGTLQTTVGITSSAINSDDNTHSIPVKNSANICDTITFYNIIPNLTYTISTRVYDSTKGQYLSITKDGVTSTTISSTFVPITDSGNYINNFSVNPSICGDNDNIMVIESLILDSVTITSNSSSLITVIPTYELGLKVNFRDKTFRRLGDAYGLSAGSDFDVFPMYKRRRCNLADDGTINAYYGDSGYSATGNNGQVMVEQPKFYYKVIVPDQSESSKWISYPTSPKEIEYWVSNKPITGYKLHPAFKNMDNNDIDFYYEGAYEGSFTTQYDNTAILCSKSNVTPKNSGPSYYYRKRTNFRKYAQRRGTGWTLETIWSYCADLLLMMIEYGRLNMQTAIGTGYTNYQGNQISTGYMDSYGNINGSIGYGSSYGMRYRGTENIWGNSGLWIDCINGQQSKWYIANSYDFNDYNTTNCTQIKFDQPPNNGNYLSALGYDSELDWLLLPIECNSSYGDSSLPIGDIFYSGVGTYITALCITPGSYDSNVASVIGPFSGNMWEYSNGYDNTSARLLYVGGGD